MTNHKNSSRQRTLAFTRRAWIQQGTMSLWFSALIGTGFALLAILGSAGKPSTPALGQILPVDVPALVAVADSNSEVLTMTSYMLLLAPALLGTLVGIIATLTLPGVVADDVNGGGIEVLLASPVPRASLFRSYLAASMVLATTSWLVASLSFGVTACAVGALKGYSVTTSVPYFVALIVLPLSLGIWSSAATLFGALLYPRSLETRAGMNGGPIRLLALAPSLVAIPSVLFLGDWVLPALGAVLVLTGLASYFIVHVTARGFRSTRLLGA
ncbi:hypothetical protein [Prescottella agglutinans]|uniref:ABC-2 type transport system permease protein n=1 Tax=Prescottella agglutinans TaxID=1644129 RepID=A0ABT6M794_9NOCA|nr:hypothetical protein [Prescottella agglutinans]MDH6279800.1 ABC-2 type transport system permease protein [Prescottella agglutinans]